MLSRKRKNIKMTQLVRLMKKLDQEVGKCSRCGICQSVCPLYKVTQRESDVARGKLMLLDGLMRSFFDDPDGVRQRLDRCLLCGSCAANCPRGVNVVEIFLNARVLITGYAGLSPVKRILFRKMLSNPDFFDRMMLLGVRWQGLFFKKIQFQMHGSCAAVVSPLLSRRRMVPLAPVPFHKIVSTLNFENETGSGTGKKTSSGAARPRVAFLSAAFWTRCIQRWLQILCGSWTFTR